MSPSSGWLGLSVFRLGMDDLLAAAPAHPADEADAGFGATRGNLEKFIRNHHQYQSSEAL